MTLRLWIELPVGLWGHPLPNFYGFQHQGELGPGPLELCTAQHQRQTPRCSFPRGGWPVSKPMESPGEQQNNLGVWLFILPKSGIMGFNPLTHCRVIREGHDARTPSRWMASSWQVDGVSRRHELVCLGLCRCKIGECQWQNWKQELQSWNGFRPLQIHNWTFPIGMYHFCNKLAFSDTVGRLCVMKNGDGRFTYTSIHCLIPGSRYDYNPFRHLESMDLRSAKDPGRLWLRMRGGSFPWSTVQTLHFK